MRWVIFIFTLLFTWPTSTWSLMFAVHGNFCSMSFDVSCPQAVSTIERILLHQAVLYHKWPLQLQFIKSEMELNTTEISKLYIFVNFACPYCVPWPCHPGRRCLHRSYWQSLHWQTTWSEKPLGTLPPAGVSLSDPSPPAALATSGMVRNRALD